MASTDENLTNLMERLKMEEERSKKHEDRIIESALMSKGKPKKRPNKNFKKSENKSETQESQKGQPGTKNCFKCGKTGHFMKGCTGQPCQAYFDYCKKSILATTVKNLDTLPKNVKKQRKMKKLFLQYH